VFTAWLGERSAAEARHLFVAARIPTYDPPDSAVRGFMHRVQHRRNQELLMETPAARPADFAPDIARAHNAITSALSAGRTWLEAAELNAVLDAYGVPLPATRLVADAEGAAAAAEIGGGVALKTHSRDLTHKSDIGGVALDLDGPDRVRSEARSMLTRVARPPRSAARRVSRAADGSVPRRDRTDHRDCRGPGIRSGGDVRPRRYGGRTDPGYRARTAAAQSSAGGRDDGAHARVAALARVSQPACGGHRWRC
jgi:acyl-CoA synthetase (NDP forming)